jgi:hypothetical protein
MTQIHDAANGSIGSSEQALVLSSLERDQLADAKRQHVPRRALKGPAIVVLAALRIYLLFMMAVVIYQIWTGIH